MPADVRLHPAAERELRAAYLWYLDQNLLAAESFRSETTHAMNAVAESPHRWPLITSQVRRYVYPRFPFSLIYRGNADLIEVIAVAHQKRKPGYWSEL